MAPERGVKWGPQRSSRSLTPGAVLRTSCVQGHFPCIYERYFSLEEALSDLPLTEWTEKQETVPLTEGEFPWIR